MEDLDVMNILECREIMEVLKQKKTHEVFFKMMIRIVNSRLNDNELDKPINWMDLEDYVEPDLSDTEDDLLEVSD